MHWFALADTFREGRARALQIGINHHQPLRKPMAEPSCSINGKGAPVIGGFRDCKISSAHQVQFKVRPGNRSKMTG